MNTSIKKVLFIAYQYNEKNSVGSFRNTYWIKHIEKVSDGKIDATVITATPKTSKQPKVIYVPIRDKKPLLSRLFTDKGLLWLDNLKKALTKEYLNQFDIVLLTGGPFLHFSIVKQIKNFCDAKVVLDFRDPYANNPRFEHNFLKKQLRIFLEKSYIENADLVITVNKYCVDILEGKPKNKIVVIDNGYDDVAIENITKHSFDSKYIHFIYPGKVYKDFLMEPFLTVLKKNKSEVMFHHVGRKENVFNLAELKIKEYGYCSYEETLSYIQASDIGVIFTGGKAFESTTKIFDFIGLYKTILIITDGTPKTGQLNNIVNKLHNVIWAKNTVKDISRAFKQAISKKEKKKNYINEQFSRKEGLQLLIKSLSEL